jgi:hypothetical protein
MLLSDFKSMADKSSITRATYFSQVEWIANHYPEGTNTLCSGLTLYWLKEKLANRSPMKQLAKPNAELLRLLSVLQAYSLYPTHPKNFTPNAIDTRILNLKYGVSDWKKVLNIVNEEHKGDFILYDLSKSFSFDSTLISHHHALPNSLNCAPCLADRTAAIGVLRYLDQGKPRGHRVVYYRDQYSQHHFFDPNAGEVISLDDSAFNNWLNLFLATTSYGKLSSTPPDPFLSVYKLHKIATLA